MTVVLFFVESFNFSPRLLSSDGCGRLFGVVGCGHSMFVKNLFKEKSILCFLSFQKKIVFEKEIGE